MRARVCAAVAIVAAFTSVASAQPEPVAPVTTETTAAPVTTESAVAVVVTPTIAHVDTQTIETPFVGTFALSGALKGDVKVLRKGDELVFSGTAAGLAFFARADVNDRAKTFRIPLGSDSAGMMNLVGGHAPSAPASTRVLALTDTGKGELTAILEYQKKKTAVTVTRNKAALVIYGTYQGGMKVFAQQCSAYYRAKGYAISEMPGDWNNVVVALATAQELGHPFSRVVIVSHGGWDGPMMTGDFIQLSGVYHDDGFGELCRAIRRGTTLDAKLIYSACHSGGSNRFETWHEDYRYSDDVAKKTGRTAVGVNGSTSTEWSKQLCLFAEGEGPARQESRISTSAGGKTVLPGQPSSGSAPVSNQPLGGPSHP